MLASQGNRPGRPGLGGLVSLLCLLPALGCARERGFDLRGPQPPEGRIEHTIGSTSLTGRATFTLDKVAAADGDRRAFVSYQLEITGTTFDEEGGDVTIRFGGSGALERSLASHLDVSNHFQGLMKRQSELGGLGPRIDLVLSGARLLGRWDGTVGELVRHGGHLSFGQVEPLFYGIQAQ